MMPILCLAATAVISLAAGPAFANPAMLPKHEGYPMGKATDPVTDKPLSNDPGQRNASGAHETATPERERSTDPRKAGRRRAAEGAGTADQDRTSREGSDEDAGQSSIRRRLDVEGGTDLRNNDGRGLARIDDQGIRRFFENIPLAGEQRLADEVPRALRQPLLQQAAVGFQIDEPHVFPVAGQDCSAIGGSEHGSGEDGGFAAGDPVADRRMETCQPRPAILVGKRNIPAQLLDTVRRMEFVSIAEPPAERGGQFPTDGGLSGAGDAHDKDHHCKDA
jgi:hypothetical protein